MITNEEVQKKIAMLVMQKSRLIVQPIDDIRDETWIKDRVGVNDLEFEEKVEYTRFFNTAKIKFGDTSLGGNFVLNPRPQFTRYADVRAKGILMGRNEVSPLHSTGSYGMGMYYSEAIDDTHQTIHLRYGRAEFNSLSGFFRSFYDNDTARYARTGRMTEPIFSFIGKAAGYVVQLVFWPLFGLLYLADFATTSARFLTNKPASKFYYLKPTMTDYWNAVTNIVNQILIYKGMTPVDYLSQGYPKEGGGKADPTDMRNFHNFFPELFSGPDALSNEPYIDIYSVANRGQRLKNSFNRKMLKAQVGGTLESMASQVRGKEEFLPDEKNSRTLKQAMQDFYNTAVGKANKDSPDVLEQHIRTKTKPDETLNKAPSGLIEHLIAELNDGSQFATLRVDSTGPVSESFQNSTRESDLSTKMNSLSAQSRAISFSLAGGNIDGGVLSGIASAAKNLTEGFLDTFNVGGFISLAGAAFVDIPQSWDNSSANLPSMSYSMQLISPYGNTVSQLQNIFIPMAMILAGVLPLSTGKQSYTSPFLCEVYDQGKAQTRLGIIDSVSFTRGTSNLGFNKRKQFLAVDVTFTIKDMSSVMHMPLNTTFSLNPLKGIFDEDTIYTDYLHVLSAATIGQNIYRLPKLIERSKINVMTAKRLTSPAYWSMLFHESPFGIIDTVVKQTDRF